LSAIHLPLYVSAFAALLPGTRQMACFRLCKQAHKSAYLQRQREQQEAEGRRRMWFDFLNAAPERAK
jgi:hypothetical protein